MRRPNPGGAMITTMQAVSRKVNLRVGGHRSDIRLDIWESTPGLVVVYRADTEGLCPACTPHRSSYRRESPLRSAERSDESFTGLERHPATRLARD
jgi:hypothetical protein